MPDTFNLDELKQMTPNEIQKLVEKVKAGDSIPEEELFLLDQLNEAVSEIRQAIKKGKEKILHDSILDAAK